MSRKINQVPEKSADTKEEKLLLGFLKQEAERIQYGQIVVEFTVRKGDITHLKSTEVSRSFKVQDAT